MADEAITREDFEALRREIKEAKWLAYAVLHSLNGKEDADTALDRLRAFIDREEFQRRFGQGTPVYAVAGSQYEHLIEADLYTLEEVAAKPRAEVEAVRGVGPATLQRMEAAMAERGLAWTDA